MMTVEQVASRLSETDGPWGKDTIAIVGNLNAVLQRFVDGDPDVIPFTFVSWSGTRTSYDTGAISSNPRGVFTTEYTILTLLDGQGGRHPEVGDDQESGSDLQGFANQQAELWQYALMSSLFGWRPRDGVTLPGIFVGASFGEINAARVYASFTFSWSFYAGSSNVGVGCVEQQIPHPLPKVSEMFSINPVIRKNCTECSDKEE